MKKLIIWLLKKIKTIIKEEKEILNTYYKEG